MVIAKGIIDEYLARKLNSYEWIKQVSSDDLKKELNTFKVKPYFKTEPWKNQLDCFIIGATEPRFLWLLDMGAGKSKIILDRATQIQREGKLKKGLITVPRLVNFDSWQEAFETHSDFGATICDGSIEEKWEKLLTCPTDFSMIDYMGLQLAVSKKVEVKAKGKKPKMKLVRDASKIRKLSKIYNFISVDESHKVKNPESLRYGILKPLTKTADYVYPMTGTLFGRNPIDLWAQFYLADRGETFGSTLGLFRAAFYDEFRSAWKGVDYRFDDSKMKILHRLLQNKSIQYQQDELQDLPSCHIQVLKLSFGEEQREHYLRAVEGLINAKGKLGDIDSAWIRMRQILSGYLPWKDEYGDHLIIFKENPKLEMQLELIEDLGDNKMVISTEFTQSGKMITEALEQRKIGFEWLYGKSKDPSSTVSRFKKDLNKQVLVMNSEAGGTGVDGLQKVARYLTFYESPVSPITRKQTLKRIWRPGQVHKTFIYDLLIKKSSDARILSFIKQGDDLYRGIVNGGVDLRSLLEI